MLSVGIYIYDEVEVLDFAGPFEVFSTAARVYQRIRPGSSKPFHVFTVGEHPENILARGGLKILPEYTVANVPRVDVLIVPGGIVTGELNKEHVVSWIQNTASTTHLTGSVCTGAFLLGKAGLLDSKKATTHWEDIADMRTMFPHIDVVENTRWVDEGNIVTSAGISAGIDMSLHLVSRLIDQDLAVKTARQMEFDWTKEK